MLLEGLLLGLFTSGVAWALARIFLRARIRFSPGISKRSSASQPCGYDYRVKIRNASFFRGVADARVDALVRARRLDSRNNASILLISLGTSVAGIPTLAPGQNRLIGIDPSFITSSMKKRLTDVGQLDLVEHDDRSLEDVLTVSADHTASGAHYLQITIVVTEAWTGRQYVVTSPKYLLEDIKMRGFAKASTRLDRTARQIRIALDKFKPNGGRRQPSLEFAEDQG